MLVYSPRSAVRLLVGPWPLRILIGVIFLALLVLFAGCQVVSPSAATVTAAQNTTDTGKAVQTKAATDTTTAANLIKSDALNGLKGGSMAAVTPLFNDIGTQADKIIQIQATASPQVSAALDTLNSNVKDLGTKLDATQAQLTKAQDAAAASARATWTIVVVVGIAIVGVAVALGFLLKDWRLAVAIGAGGGTVMVLALLVGYLSAILGGMIGWLAIFGAAVVVAWIIGLVAETVWKKELGITWWQAFTAALHTSPLQDYKDLLAELEKKVNTPAPPPAPAPPAPTTVPPGPVIATK